MSDPKFVAYSEAKCTSTREEFAAIHGTRVGIIDRRQKEDGSWEYTVSPNDSYAFYLCEESELAPIAPVDLFADERPFATIRRALESCLDQDWDCRYASVADALVDAVRSADHEKFRAELDELAQQPDATLREVFDSCAINLPDLAHPRDLLVTIRTLADLL